MKEIWKSIPNYENYYMVSNLGNVISLRNKRNLKLIKVPNLFADCRVVSLN